MPSDSQPARATRPQRQARSGPQTAAARLRDDLVTALDEVRPADAAELAEAFARLLRSEPEIPEPVVVDVLTGLQRKLKHLEVTEVFDAAEVAGHTGERVIRLYVQSQIDRGDLPGASRTIASSLADRLDEPRVLGLRARVAKQRFVRGATGSLLEAIRLYGRAVGSYSSPDPYPLVNVVALLARAEQDGTAIPDDDLPPGGGLAQAELLLQRADGLTSPTMWDHAIAMEAALALPRTPENLAVATRWLERYLDLASYPDDERPDAFEYNSTRRQLQEIWRLDTADAGYPVLLDRLNQALTTVTGGVATVDRDALTRAQHLGNPHREILARGAAAEAVAAVYDRDVLVGGGVLVSGAELGLPDAPRVLVTTYSLVPAVTPTLRCTAWSLAGDRVDLHGLSSVWESSYLQLDVQCLRVDDPRALDLRPAVLADGAGEAGVHLASVRETADGPQLATVLGRLHGIGPRELSFGADGPTTQGAPLFDPSWRAVGIQGRADGRGPSLGQVRAAIAAT